MNRQLLENLDSWLGVSVLALLVIAFVAAHAGTTDSVGSQWSMSTLEHGMPATEVTSESPQQSDAGYGDNGLAIGIQLQGWDDAKVQKRIAENVISALVNEARP